MIITISGMPGSGKSTIGKKLVEKYKLEYFNMGRMQRDIAKKRGLTPLQLNKLEETDPSIDKEVDDYQKKLGKKDNILVDSRIGWHFIPNSIKIFLKVDLKEAVKRIIKHGRDDEKYKDEREAEKSTKERLESEKKRYKEYYNIKDFTDRNNYDLYLDTTDLTLEEVFSKVVKFLESKKKGSKI